MAVTYIPRPEGDWGAVVRGILGSQELDLRAQEIKDKRRMWLADLARQTENDQMFKDATGYSLVEPNPFQREGEQYLTSLGQRPDDVAIKSQFELEQDAQSQLANDAFFRKQALMQAQPEWVKVQLSKDKLPILSSIAEQEQMRENGPIENPADKYLLAARDAERRTDEQVGKEFAGQEGKLLPGIYKKKEAENIAEVDKRRAEQGQWDKKSSMAREMAQANLPGGFTKKVEMLTRMAEILGPDHPMYSKIRDYAILSAGKTYERDVLPYMLTDMKRERPAGKGGPREYKFSYNKKEYVMPSQTGEMPSIDEVKKFIKAKGITSGEPIDSLIGSIGLADKGIKDLNPENEQLQLDRLVAELGNSISPEALATLKGGLPKGVGLTAEKGHDGNYYNLKLTMTGKSGIEKTMARKYVEWVSKKLGVEDSTATRNY